MNVLTVEARLENLEQVLQFVDSQLEQMYLKGDNPSENMLVCVDNKMYLYYLMKLTICRLIKFLRIFRMFLPSVYS